MKVELNFMSIVNIVEAAGIKDFYINSDIKTVYVVGLKRLSEYLGLSAAADRVVYGNWMLVEGIPVT